MSNLFQKLELEAFRAGITPRTQESREWFRRKVQRLRNINRDRLMDEDLVEKRNKGVVGSMYMFYYDPKHKETLPYYDKFPLSIIVGPAEGGFYGMNLHYLPPTLRAKFLDGLMDTVNNRRFDESTKFRVTYQYLKKTASLKYFKPCFKHYLNEHVESKFAEIQAPEWEIATFLPTASWAKSNNTTIYKDSRRMI